MLHWENARSRISSPGRITLGTSCKNTSQGRRKAIQITDIRTEDDIIIVRNRTEKCLEISNNSKHFMLVSNNHQLTKLYDTCIHEQGHFGIAATVSKIRVKCWVIQFKIFMKLIVNKLAKHIEDRCSNK